MPANEFPRRRTGKPRLPWKRGPRAWEIAQRAAEILDVLKSSRRGFYSLRRTAKLLGISTQPVRDWIRLGQLKREGPRRQISRAELKRFVYELIQRAEPFDPYNYVRRIEDNRKTRSWPWRKRVFRKSFLLNIDSLAKMQISILPARTRVCG